MRVVAINGSPHKEGNTYLALRAFAEALEDAGIACRIIHVGHKSIRGCTACGMCAKNKDEKCVLKDDLNDLIQELKDADGIVLGSPVYYAGIAGTMKCFCDRVFYVASANGHMFRHKVGAAVVAMRRSGGVASFDQLNHYFTISEMPVAAASYWNVVHGAAQGEALQDAEGMQTVRVSGENMAWMLRLIENGRDTVGEPPFSAGVKTNFVR